jgi:putative transposase
MAAANAAPVVPAQRATSRNWGFGWLRRTALGAIREIVGALSNLGYHLARGTVSNILMRNGIEPAPERSRKTRWKEFLAQHWDMIVAADCFTIEVWTARGLQRFVVLFFIELSSRRVEISGISAAANGLWMSQIARNLTDSVDGCSWASGT